MAIRLMTFPAGGKGVISLNYSRDRQDNGKVSLTCLNSCPDNALWTSGMTQVSSMRSDTPEGTIVTEEYIGSSYLLDTHNIVLFRRGLPHDTYTAEKEVVIPTASFSFSEGGKSGTFTFGSETRIISVERQKSAGGEGGRVKILGEEEWASNPCEASTVSYDCSVVGGIVADLQLNINIEGYVEGRCSAEGSYRSILSSTTTGWMIGPECSLNSSSGDECLTLEDKTGSTLEGSYYTEVWTFSKVAGGTRTGSATVTIYETKETSPVKHPNYPTEKDWTNEMIPAKKKLDALDAAGRFSFKDLAYEFGWSRVDIYDSLLAEIILYFSNAIIAIDFATTFGVPLQLQLQKTDSTVSPETGEVTDSYRVTGLILLGGTWRDWVASLMGINVNVGITRFLGGWTVKDAVSVPQKNAELFYPAPTLNNKTFEVDQNQHKFYSKTMDVTVSPTPEQREWSEIQNEEGESEKVRATLTEGALRSVQAVAIDESANMLIEGQDSSFWDESYSNRIVDTNPEPLRYILDGPVNYKNNRGNFFNILQQGYRTFAVLPNLGWSINVLCGERADNPNDLTSVAGYKEDEAVVESQTSGAGKPILDEEAAQWDDPCEDIIKVAEKDADTVSGTELVYGDPAVASGITDAKGTVCTGRVNGPSGSAAFEWVLPSEAAMQWVIKTVYTFNASIRGITDATNIWNKGSGKGCNNVLNYSIVIQEIASKSDGTVDQQTVGLSGGSCGRVGSREYTVMGMVDASCAASISATLSSDGLVSTVRIEEQRPKIGQSTVVIMPQPIVGTVSS